MFKTLQSALFASFFGVIILTLLVLTLLIIPVIKTSTINHLSTSLYKQISLAQGDFILLINQKAGTLQMQNAVLKTSKATESRVTLINRTGTVLADSAVAINRISSLKNHSDRPEIIAAAKKGSGKDVRTSETIKKELIYTAKALKDKNGQVIGYLRMALPLDYANLLIWDVFRSALIVLFAAVILAAGISLFFARTFAEPIEKLSAAAQKIAQGDFSKEILLRSRFEIGKLEASLEQMRIKLGESFSRFNEEKGRILAIISSMSEGVIAIDKEGRIILANPIVEQIFNVLEPQILDKTVREAIFNNELADLFDEILQSQKFVSKEMEIVTPVARSFMVQGDIVRSEEGEVLGAVCVLYDITEIRKLENYRSEFVANVSHELKTPLTAIRSFVETLLGGAIDDKERNVEFLQKIEKHAVNLSQLIDDILEISRLESKTEIGPFDTVSLNRIVLRVIDIVTEKAKKKQIQIKFASPGREPMIMGIEDHLYRAVLNLLDNAVNYTPEGGMVTITCEIEGNNLLLKVADTGIGIPTEHLPRIFERFYRVDKARSRDLGGTGLGLAIVKHVMTLHHGSVSVESIEGKGASFTLSFPVLG